MELGKYNSTRIAGLHGAATRNGKVLIIATKDGKLHSSKPESIADATAFKIDRHTSIPYDEISEHSFFANSQTQSLNKGAGFVSRSFTSDAYPNFTSGNSGFTNDAYPNSTNEDSGVMSVGQILDSMDLVLSDPANSLEAIRERQRKKIENASKFPKQH